MPSTSTFSEITFHNGGPLTTTFTPAASCATETKNVMLSESGDSEFWSVTCPAPSLSGCLPTGTTTPAPTSTGLDPEDLYQASYFSPGIYCPAGWDTVGVAGRKGDASVTSDGAFVYSSTLPKTIWMEQHVGFANGLMQILDPSETAVLCCPSSMTANTKFGCYSTLPDYTPSTACAWRAGADDFDEVTRTAPFDGTTVVWEDLYTITASDPAPLTDHHETISPSYASKYGVTGVSVVPIVTLVHKGIDMAAATVGTTSNAAVRTTRGGAWDGLGGVLGVAVGGIMLGAAIILA